MAYADMHRASLQDPNAFWMEQAQAIDWVTPPSKALFDENAPLYEWFKDAQCNTCWNAVDRHVEAGRGEQTAIIHDSPITHTKREISYVELRNRVANLAGALRAKGVEKGDRVIIYMPMIPEALEAMLACARLGAVHSVVFGGFAANELAVRIDDAHPKAIIAASCGLEPGRVVHYKPLLDAAIDAASHKPDFCVIFQREQEVAKLTEGRDYNWHGFQYGVARPNACRSSGDHPAYILYTSGTTGQPKGVVRPTPGHMVALHWTMKAIYNVDPGDVFWAASDVGWVVGHSYICYAPLMAGNTTIVFEGKPVGTPDAGTFWRVISEHKVKASSPRRRPFRAVKREDPKGEIVKKYDLSCLKQVLPRGRARGPRHHPMGAGQAGRAGHRPLVADRNRLGHCRQPAGRRTSAGQDRLARPWRCRAMTCRCWTRAAIRSRPGTLGAIALKLPCRRARCPRCGTPKPASAKATWSNFPAITRRRCGLCGRRRLCLHHGADR